MRITRIEIGVACLCLSALATAAAAAPPAAPQIVSPGGTASLAAAELCPTFSWAGVRGARRYEIVVYEMDADWETSSRDALDPVLRITLPGAAASWTPPADRCLASGARHVWFVRAIGRQGAAGGWSEGGMFGTPRIAVPAALEQAVTLAVENYLARGREATAERPAAADRQAGGRGIGLKAMKTPSATGARSAPPLPAQPTADAFGIRAETPQTSGALTFGLYGISNSSEDESSGVVGYASGTFGDTRGVAGFSRSPDGIGVYGENDAAIGGIGVLGVDVPGSGTEPSAGTVGITTNANGFGGFFWNDASGDALVVANPNTDPIEIKFFVDTAGNVGLEGVVELTPTDSPPGCDGSLEGAVYYDATEHWLCICTETAADPLYGWRRADDPADDCAM